MVGARGGAFTADGEYLSVRFGDGVRYFRADGTEVEDAATEFAGTAYAQAVERGRTFAPIGSPSASRRCFDDGGMIYCGGDDGFQEAFTWSQESPDQALADVARTVSADATTAADVFLLEDGSEPPRVCRRLRRSVRELWADAHADLQPRAEEARRRIQMLAESGSDS